MMALYIYELVTKLTAAKWVSWVVLYLILGIFVPWALTQAWAQQHKTATRPQFKQLLQHGELGLVGLMLAIATIWDLQKSQYSSHTIALGSVFLGMTGIMSGSVWVEAYCRRITGIRYTPQRMWRDSRSLVFLVFSLALVTEILLDRFAKVAAQ